MLTIGPKSCSREGGSVATKHEAEEVDLGEALGASDSTSTQVLTMYVPNKDRDGTEFGAQRKWEFDDEGASHDQGQG